MFSIKSFFTFIIFFTGLAVGLLYIEDANAQAGGRIVDVRPSQGRIEVDFVVENPAPEEITGVNVEIRQTGIFCQHNFSIPASFGQTVTAVCDMGETPQGVYPLEISRTKSWPNQPVVIDSTNINYQQGVPPTAGGDFVGSPVRNSNGTYTFNIQLGRAGINTYADIALSDSGLVAHWNSGAEYSCSPGEVPFDWLNSKNISITCDFRNLPPKQYTMNLYDSRVAAQNNILDSVSFDISLMDLRPPIAINNAQNPNRFNVQVERFSAAAPTTFSLKILDPNTRDVSDAITHTKAYTGVGLTTFENADFNTLPPGTYTLVLVDTGNNILDRESITIATNVFADTCTCRVMSTVNSCTPAPAMEVVRNSCFAGKTTVLSCADSTVLGGGVGCACACSGTSTVNPGGAIVTSFDEGDLQGLLSLVQNVIIAIAVVSGVFIIPYAFILMASGNPEKIKQGTDWLKSIFWGYLVIFLSGALIRIVGGEILSLGL